MSMSLARRNTEYGRIAKADKAIADLIPYSRHVDETTLETKSGDLIQIIKITGLPFETMDQRELDMRKNVRAALLRNVGDPNIALYHHIIRRKINPSLDGSFGNSWCQKLDTTYKHHLQNKRMFVNEQYISVMYRPNKGITGKISSFLKKADKDAYEYKLKENVEFLHKRTHTLLSKLDMYETNLLSMYEDGRGLFSECLSFLSYLINLEHREIRVPLMDIAHFLPTKRLFIGKEAIELRGMRQDDNKVAAILSIKEYGSATGAGMLDPLLRLNREYILTQSFEFTAREPALQKMYRIRRQLKSTDTGATTLESEIDEGIDNAASGLSVYGTHHMTVMAHEQSLPDLSMALTELDTVFAESGLNVVREDMNMEAAYWAQLPGNFPFIARKCPITNYNFASFASLHNFPIGKPEGNHWGKAICLLETTSNTPYYFNFHVGQVGNFTLIGPTGGGKTVLMEFLVAQALRHQPRVVYFDKDRSAEIFLRTIGGDYTIIRSGVGTGLNPLQLPDSPSNRAFLCEWIRTLLLLSDTTPLSHEEEEIIADAVDQNYQVANLQHRNLSSLSSMFTGYTSDRRNSLTSRLQKWHGNGEMAWLFDNIEDSLSLGNPVIGFDLTSILDDRNSRTPWLMYIFHRINEMMNGDKIMIMLDEGWKLVDDPIFSDRIKNWHKTIRKQNGLIGFATQSPADALKSKIADAIIEQSPTQIFLPNPKARHEDYCDGFSLSEQEFNFIKNTAPEERTFLIKHHHDSVIAKLDLSGMDEFLHIFSGTTKTVELLENLRQHHGDVVEHWYEDFQRNVKELSS
jgi:type IV secretion system protein VirB4